MFNYVYEITNLINGRKYIGKRSCHCEIKKDRYMGSGIALTLSIKKYGIENFSKKILKEFKTSEMAFEYEKELIFELDCVANPLYYNMADGGIGGVGTLAGKTELEKWEIYNRMKNTLKGKMAGEKNPMYGRRGKDNPKYGIPLTDEQKENVRKSLKGKPFTDEHKENIRKSRIGMKLSEEHKQNIGLGGRGRKMGDKCRKALNNSNIKKVVLINNGLVFNSMKEACQFVSLKGSSPMAKCCRGERDYSGKSEGSPAIWMYLNDYNYCIENSVDFNLYKKEKYHK